MSTQDNFYKEKTFDLILDAIGEVKADQKAMKEKVDRIDRHIAYVYGMAAAFSFIFTLAWTFIKEWINRRFVSPT